MKLFYIIGIILGLIAPIFSQDLEIDPAANDEQIQKAIEEFNRSKNEKPNEVTVVLPPPEETTPPRAVAVEETDADDSEASKPVLVSGKPPGLNPTDTEQAKIEEAETIEPNTELAIKNPDEVDPPVVTENIPEPLTVRVESIRTGSGKIDPQNIEIKSSFPTKALTTAPAGWILETNEKAPSFSRQVEIEPGTFIALEITPHILSPVADGAEIFSVTEPGYNFQNGYQQDQTVGSILESSITQLDTDSLKMGHALSELHRLLASLPKPTTPASNTTPAQKP